MFQAMLLHPCLWKALKILAVMQGEGLEPNIIIIMYVGSGMRACTEGIPLTGDFKASGNDAVSKIGAQVSLFCSAAMRAC